ncbi:Uncharacterized protein dnm_095360 [Desulfonema magnum]|uniref:Uncharacterized protein n=1 Tax=Desulfonema magnum TaxID=45655 RepID=A0A975GTS9_9BACT|nr:Uncharacterized protein dnm_095360 [Desulfonema magnum]
MAVYKIELIKTGSPPFDRLRERTGLPKIRYNQHKINKSGI